MIYHQHQHITYVCHRFPNIMYEALYNEGEFDWGKKERITASPRTRHGIVIEDQIQLWFR